MIPPDSPDMPADANAILAALQELLSQGDITSDRFIRAVREHPELLTKHAEILCQALADLQKTAQAKATVEAVARLLARARQSGPDQAILEHARETGRFRGEQRLEEQRQRLREQRREGINTREGSSDRRGSEKRPSVFPSLLACVQYLTESYPQETTELETRPIEASLSSRTCRAKWPAMAFEVRAAIFQAQCQACTDLEHNLAGYGDVVWRGDHS
jgi:hypothetical protein